jgi:hypothetical protein
LGKLSGGGRILFKNPKEVGCEVSDWIQLAQDCGPVAGFCAHSNASSASIKVNNLLTSSVTKRFEERICTVELVIFKLQTAERK